MYAVIKTGGKQYKVEEGDLVSVEKLGLEAGDSIVFDEVLLFNNGETLTVGTPVIENAKVSGSVVENGKASKVIIYKYKSKKDYRKKKGHRQPFTTVMIDKIEC